MRGACTAPFGRSLATRQLSLKSLSGLRHCSYPVTAVTLALLLPSLSLLLPLVSWSRLFWFVSQITFVLLGARVVTDYIVAALNPYRW